MGTRRVVIEFLGADKSASKTAQDVEKQTGHLEKSTGRLGSTMAGVGKTAALGLAGGLLAAGGAAVKFIGDYEESARVGRLTEAAIKSTGGAAHVTAKQVGDLAGAISLKTGADDEAIQSGANLLLTFTGVKNEVGKGNDIFNQATSMVTDMTAALNGGQVSAEGIKGSSIQLGKALNDPIKGVGALTKVGVSFTTQQKDQIKALVASGDKLGAQKVILGELSKEFGGAAAAAASPFDRLKVAAGNVSEQLGGYLAPAAEKVATFLANNLPGAMDKASAFAAKIAPPIKEAAKAFGDWLLPKIKELSGWVRSTLLPVLRDIGTYVTTYVLPRIKELGQWVQANLLPVIKDFANVIVTQVLPKIRQLAEFIMVNVIPVVQKLVTGALAGAKDAFERVRKAIEDNKPQLEKLAHVIGVVVKWVAEKLGPILGWLAKTVLVQVGKNISNTIGFIGKMVTIVQKISKAVGDAAGWIGKKWTEIKNGANTLLTFFHNLPGAIARKLGDTMQTLLAKGRNLVTGLSKGATDRATSFLEWVKGIPASVGRWLGDTGRTLASKGRALIDGLKSGAIDGMKGIGSWLKSNVVDPIINSVKSFFGIKSPSTVFAGIGGHLVAGLMKGLGQTNGADIAKKIFGDMPSALGHIVNKGLVSIGSLPSKALDALGGLGGKLKGIGGKVADIFGGGGGGGAGVERWRNVALQALQAAGAPVSWINSLLRRMNQESGGNPNAINLTDSNAQAGHPSQGLMQTIPGTFAAYAGPYASRGITDPFANIFAAINYARDRYGSGPAGWDQAGGYALGTPWVPDDQLAYLHKGEAVIPAAVNRQRLKGGGGSEFLGTVRLELTLDGKVLQTKLLELKRRNGYAELGIA